VRETLPLVIGIIVWLLLLEHRLLWKWACVIGITTAGVCTLGVHLIFPSLLSCVVIRSNTLWNCPFLLLQLVMTSHIFLRWTLWHYLSWGKLARRLSWLHIYHWCSTMLHRRRCIVTVLLISCRWSTLLGRFLVLFHWSCNLLLSVVVILQHVSPRRLRSCPLVLYCIYVASTSCACSCLWLLMHSSWVDLMMIVLMLKILMRRTPTVLTRCLMVLLRLFFSLLNIPLAIHSWEWGSRLVIRLLEVPCLLMIG
jgi:hypothetical protein